MTTMRFTDAATISGTRKTADGYLVTEAFAVRTGIQLYRGADVGVADKEVVRVYRPEAEVRDAKSLASFSHAPITLGHPAEFVTADNWADLAKGEVSTEAEWDGNRIKLPLIVKDAATIAAIEGGTRDLSAGYNCEVEIVDGTTPDGEAYDAIQRNIRINHLAVVKHGRAGNTRIGDSAAQAVDFLKAAIALHERHMSGDAPTTGPAGEKSQQKMMDMMKSALAELTGDDGGMAMSKTKPGHKTGDTWGASPFTPDGKELGMADTILKTVVLGDQAVQVAAVDAQTAENFKTASAKALTDAKADHDKAIAAKDAALATKDAEIAALKAKVLDGAALDKMVADRADLIGKAKAIAATIVTDGKSAAEIKRAAVDAKAGAAMTDKSDAYIDAMFDIMAADAGKAGDPAAKALADARGRAAVTDADRLYADRNKALSDSWKPGKKEAV